MHQLLLLRHAKSAWDDPTVNDRDRKLNGRGRRAATAMRTALRARGLAPDLVLVSPATRTLETLALLDPWDETPLIEQLDSLYLAPADRLLEELRLVPETVRSVLLIGHNPGLHDLAVHLAGPRALAAASVAIDRLVSGYPTGTLAEFSIAGPWRDLGLGGGQLLHLLRPRDILPPDSSRNEADDDG